MHNFRPNSRPKFEFGDIVFVVENPVIDGVRTASVTEFVIDTIHYMNTTEHPARFYSYGNTSLGKSFRFKEISASFEEAQNKIKNLFATPATNEEGGDTPVDEDNQEIGEDNIDEDIDEDEMDRDDDEDE